MKNPLFAFLLLALTLTACKPELPPVTRVGANSVGALVDGNVWLPQINGLRPNISASFDEADNLLTVTATNLGDGTYFLWELQPLPAEDTYVLADWEANGIRFEYGEISDQQGGDRRPYVPVDGSGALEITLLDTDNGVFAGTFSFDVTSPTGDVITIQDGRFDVRF